jgi:hypothetical protein
LLKWRRLTKGVDGDVAKVVAPFSIGSIKGHTILEQISIIIFYNKKLKKN